MPDLSDALAAPSSDSDPRAESVLRLAAQALGAPLAQAFRFGPGGPEPTATRNDGWTLGAPDLRGVVATLGDTPEPFDVSALAGGDAWAGGIRVGHDAALVVVRATAPDDGWQLTLAAAAGALASPAAPDPTTAFLADLAGEPGPFTARLPAALGRAAALLGLPAAALVRIEDGTWEPDTVWDPERTGLFDRAARLEDKVCRGTVQADGPVAMHALDEGDVRAYLGVPVFVAGRPFGTLCFAGPVPRATPFTDAERALGRSMSRWAGHALAGRLDAQALATREALLGTLYASAPVGLGTIELLEAADAADDVRFVSVNRALSSMLGTAAGSADGETAEALGVPVRMRRLWTGACRRAGAGAAPRRFEFAPAEGRVCAATIARITSPTAPEHVPPRFVVVVEDVTMQRSATESLREEQAGLGVLLAHAPVFIATADLDGTVTSLRGQPPTEGAATVFDLFPGSVPSGAALHRALAGEPSVWTAELGARTLHARATSLRDPSGHRTGLAVVSLDVTAQAAAARAAADTDARSTAATELRRALVENLAHELRTPLTTLLGYTDLVSGELDAGDLSGDALADALTELRDVAARAGHRVLDAVADLQELVLLGETHAPAAIQPSDAADLVRDAADAYRGEAHALGIALEVHADAEGGPILLDARLLGRAARQLVSAALYMPGTRRLDVRLSTAGDAVMLTVERRGEPAADLSRADAARDAAERLARAMGGVVRVDRADIGDRVRLAVPRRPVRLVDLGSGDAPAPLPASAAPSPPGPAEAPASSDVTPPVESCGAGVQSPHDAAETVSDEDTEAATGPRAAPSPPRPAIPSREPIGKTIDLDSLLNLDGLPDSVPGARRA